MDKLTKLEALTGGEARVDPTSETENSWHIPAVKANNIYEGTDSEDDEIIMSRGHRILDEETDEVDYKDGPSSGKSSSSSSRSCLQIFLQRKHRQLFRHHGNRSIRS